MSLQQTIRRILKEETNEIKDIEKLEFANKYWDEFIKYCKLNVDEITDELINTAYCEFKIFDVNVVITIDDLMDSLGQYNDESKTLTICLFRFFKQFLSKVDELDELPNHEKKLIIDGIKTILTNPYKNDISRKFNEYIRETFVHEITHHFDAISYGQGYINWADKLEKIRGEIEDEDKMRDFYFNMPHEINTRIITALYNLFNNHGTEFGDFETFFEMVLNYFPEFHKLNNENKRKVTKRLYKYYSKLQK